ncbi:MAG TPA: formyltransferase family protein [Ktedonobacteraceae bacterium]|nr:formyltransferase family protein [Ktedonobacteraceae bacterium]
MSNNISTKRPPRVLFFGMPGAFSTTVLRTLLRGEIDVAAVVLAAEPLSGQKHGGPAIRARQSSRKLRAPLPLLNSPGSTLLNELIDEHALTTWEVLRFSDAETLETLGRYQADVICVACFAEKLPYPVLKLARLGCVNVHPALLPHNRGPVPLFWTFREGLLQSGVTIHYVEERLDSGDILAQEAFELPDGISYASLEERCAELGGQLLTRVVWEMAQGQSSRVPQDESASSYQPFPETKDFMLPLAEAEARHAYNFVEGLAKWDQPPSLQVEEKIYPVRRALTYSYEMSNGDVEERNQNPQDKTLWLPCSEGWVQVETL